jgi:DNA mismatch repair protein MutS
MTFLPYPVFYAADQQFLRKNIIWCEFRKRRIMSLLWKSTENYRFYDPGALSDLSLDDYFFMITAGRFTKELDPMYHKALKEPEDIYYRQAVFKDLENKKIFDALKSFSDQMIIFAEKQKTIELLSYKSQRDWYLLDMLVFYFHIVDDLSEVRIEPHSEALKEFFGHVRSLVSTDTYKDNRDKSYKTMERINAVHYTVHLDGTYVTVRNGLEAPDYEEKVRKVFSGFEGVDEKSYLYQGFTESTKLNEVEEMIIDLYKAQNNELFDELDSIAARACDLIDPDIDTAFHELQFYLSYINFMTVYKKRGVEFSYPLYKSPEKSADGYDTAGVISPDEGETDKPGRVRIIRGYNVAIGRLSELIVPNDIKGPGRIFLVTGANQGGKTTFARMAGQILFLGTLGVPVPARSAELFIPDNIFTHFETDEDVRTENGKLKLDIIKIKNIMDQATENTVLIMNETFSSTTIDDAMQIAGRILKKIDEKKLFCIYVTFLEGLAHKEPFPESLISEVVPGGIRTYHIINRKSDGKSYAKSLAEKHRLTGQEVRDRIIRK